MPRAEHSLHVAPAPELPEPDAVGVAAPRLPEATLLLDTSSGVGGGDGDSDGDSDGEGVRIGAGGGGGGGGGASDVVSVADGGGTGSNMVKMENSYPTTTTVAACCQ